MMDVTVVQDDDAARSWVRISERDLKAINEVHSDEEGSAYHIVTKKPKEPLR